jgi:hypothetical protein
MFEATRVVGSPGTVPSDGGYRVPSDLSAGVQQLLHGVPGTNTEVDDVVLARLHRLQRCEVHLAQVDDVQVVPDRGAVG